MKEAAEPVLKEGNKEEERRRRRRRKKKKKKKNPQTHTCQKNHSTNKRKKEIHTQKRRNGQMVCETQTLGLEVSEDLE